jgi:hypothetical protein
MSICEPRRVLVEDLVLDLNDSRGVAKPVLGVPSNLSDGWRGVGSGGSARPDRAQRARIEALPTRVDYLLGYDDLSLRQAIGSTALRCGLATPFFTTTVLKQLGLPQRQRGFSVGPRCWGGSVPGAAHVHRSDPVPMAASEIAKAYLSAGRECLAQPRHRRARSTSSPFG